MVALDRDGYGADRVDGQSAGLILNIIVMGNIIAGRVFDDNIFRITKCAGIRFCSCIRALGAVSHAGEGVTVKQAALFNVGKLDFLAGVSTGVALAGEGDRASGYFKAAGFIFDFVVSLNFIACRSNCIIADIFTGLSADCVNNSLIVARAGYSCAECRRIVVSVYLGIVICSYGYVFIVVECDHVL